MVTIASLREDWFYILGSPLRFAVGNLYRRLIPGFSRVLRDAELRESAVVVAPHPDDETLGCGGTIVRKRRLGAAVDIIFLTGGGRSHSKLIDPEALRSIRVAEAREAGARLGVAEGHLHMLDFPDGGLAGQATAATVAVAQLLAELEPRQVFIPYRGEAPPDHRAAHDIVRAALAGLRVSPVVLEYPVWYWNHWPWTSGQSRTLGRRAALRRAARSAFGARLLFNFRTRVDIGDVLGEKHAALAAYASQTTRRNGDPKWAVLGDVADGQWLDCFFQPWEVFSTTVVPKGAAPRLENE